jgi:predicted ATPase
LAVTSFSLGKLAATRDHSEQAAALYDPRLHRTHCDLYGQDPKVTSLSFGAVALWLLGYPEQARIRSREAVRMGNELGHPTTRALALYFAAMVGQYCGDVAAVQENAVATAVIGIEHGLSLWQANGLVMGGWAQAKQGAFDRGIAMLRQGLSDWSETGAETHRSYFFALLAEALTRAGQHQQAVGVLTDGLKLLQTTGSAFYGAELHRLRGESLLREESDDASGDAEACFRRALAIARAQQARLLELRAAMSLTRLYLGQGRKPQARLVLADCYNWFTEGLDTPELQQAAVLLRQAC